MKYQYLETKLLFSDFYFYLFDGAAFGFFVDHYGGLTIAGAVLTLLALLGLVLCFRWDTQRWPRSIALVGGILSLLAGEAIYRFVLPDSLATRVYWLARFNDQHLSEFIISARAFLPIANAPLLLGKSYPDKESDFAPCVPPQNDGQKPNIILILHESSVDPAIYFAGEQYRVPREFFESGDHKRRRMRVETYGGRTWMSEYGALLGVDVNYFKPRASYLGVLGAGRFQNTLPQELDRLGYRTVANYPSPTSFLNTERFYKSIGFHELRGPEDMGLYITRTEKPRDKEYYEYLMRDLKVARSDNDGRPAFYFVWTTATHYPYDFVFSPADRANEVSDDPDAEFARRQRLAADDLAWFQTSLAANFPDEGFLIVGFGDHHPLITRPYVSKKPIANTRPTDPDEYWTRTYYRVDGVNFTPDYSDLSDDIEIGYLGETLLSAAKLPKSPAFVARTWLRQRCGDTWITCADKVAVDRVNAALSGGSSSIFAK